MAPEESRKSKERRRRKASTDSDARSIAESEVSNTNTIEETPTKPAPWRSLFAFSTKRNLPILITGIIVSVLAGATGPAQTLIVGELFDGFTLFASGAVTSDEFMKRESKYIVYVTAIAAASWLLHALEFMLWLAFGELQAACARDRLFHGLMAKETEWYDMRKNGIGAQLPRMQAQIRELQLASAQPLGSLFALASTGTLSLVQAFVKSPKLTLVTLASTPVILALAVLAGRPMQANLIKMQDKLTEAQKYTTSAFTAIETVKCFNGQDIEAAQYRGIIDQAAIFYAWVAHGSALQMALIVMLSVSMFVQGFYYGGVLIAKGEITSGDVVTTFFSAVGAFQAIQGILPQMIVLEKGRAAGSTLRAIVAQIETKSKLDASLETVTPTVCVGNIEVKNLTFAYPSRPDVPAVQDITLYIQGGDISFLIGRSGSGKSTISQLLMRFYNAPAGTITVDGVPLERLDTNWLRSNVTLVEQTSMLFNDTVFRNIAFGRKDHEDVTKEEVMEAVQFALLQLMISDMPDGLETMVGTKGGSMSGGQRQRMALARARLRDTPILILDESTSALDHITRTLVMEALRNWRKGKTTIIITHDITQILSDDYVYMLENGKVVQEGYRRQLETTKDTPFQAFLSEDEVNDFQPPLDIKDLEFNDRDSWSSDISSDSPRPLPQNKATYFDPLDAELTATEKKRQSKLPNVFQEGSPMPIMRAPNQKGVNSPFASPFMRVTSNFSPVDMVNITWNRASPTDPAKGIGQGDDSADQRSSLAWEKLIDQTGKFAVDLRRARPGVTRQRRPLEDIEEIPLTGPDDALATLQGKSAAQQEAANNTYKVIFSTLWPGINFRAKVSLVIGFWGATVHGVATPVFSFILSKLLATYAVPGGQKSKQLAYSMAILGVAVLDAVHTYAYRFLLEVVGEWWVDGIRTRAYERILDQDREFFAKKENGIPILAESLDRNAEEMRNLVARFAPLAYIAFIMTTVSITWAIVSQWKVTLIALTLAPYIFGVTKMFARVAETWESRSNDASDNASAIFTETFTSIKTVRALTLEDHFLEKYTIATNQALVVGFKRSFYAGFFFGLSDSAGNFATALIFYVGAKIATEGANINDIITVFAMLIFCIVNVSAILEYIPQMASSKDTAARLLRLAKLPKDSHEHLGDTRITTVGDIVLDNLKFSYPSRPDQTVLKNINLRLQPGTTTAIVGGSGSGKSTIANLLLDLYSTSSLPGSKPTDLTFGSRSIQHISTPSLRNMIVPVSQTPTLFAATVSQNIAYGLPSNHPSNTSANITSAAQKAGIHDFILSLPSGYNTSIGEGGLGLSGGQAQRIAIARALVRNPSVLILDEATSALDIETANLIRQTIQALIETSRSDPARSQPMTVIIITHHKSMMEIAERVVVLDEGRIVEVGTFGELSRKEGGALKNLLSGGEWMGESSQRDSRRVSKRTSRTSKRRSGMPVLRDVDWGKGTGKGKGRTGG